MAERVAITHAPTILGTVFPPPSPGGTYANSSWIGFGLPLEKEVEVGSDTTIMLASSNMHPQLRGTYRWNQTSHIVGLRFASGGEPLDTLLFGSIDLDMRNTDFFGTTGFDNGEEATAFALGDDCFLVIKQAGEYMVDWTASTVAYILRVDENGQPVVVEKKIIQAPGYYCPRRQQLLFLAPTEQWAIDEEYMSQLPLVITNDEFGCFGIAVSPAGFGAKVRYPDPPRPPNDGVLDAWEWGGLGQSINSGAVLYMYYKSLLSGSGWVKALYYPETGVVENLTNSFNDLTLASTEGEVGDVYTMIDNLYFTWFWNNNSMWQLTGTTFTQLDEWDEFGWLDEPQQVTFTAFDDVVQYNLSWSDRTWLGGEERRFGVFQRTIPLDPPVTTLEEIYNASPLYQSIWPTIETFRAAMIESYGSEQAYLDFYNADGEHVGWYVGFQGATPTVEDTHWGMTNSLELDTMADGVNQLVGVAEGDLGSIYYTISEAPGSEGSYRTITRWDPATPTSIYGKHKLDRRRFT